jgi:hypothetical protein
MVSMYHTGLTVAVTVDRPPLLRHVRAVRLLVALACAVIACSKSNPQQPPPGADHLPAGVRASVLQHHNDAQRSGVYVDASLTRAAAAHLRQDGAFHAPLNGTVYAQPLYWDGGEGGQDLLIVATQNNEVIAFDPLTGSRIWSRTVAAPAKLSELPCGNIDTLGIIGTPIIDASRGILYADAMVSGARHRIHALSVADGSVAGTPIDVQTAVPGFDARIHNQRGALALVDGTLYVAYGAHEGDCEAYSGWVIGLDPAGLRPAAAYHTGPGGGIWAVGGVSAMAGSLFVATGNTQGISTWDGGEAILKLAPGPSFSGKTADYYTAADWSALDGSDSDIGTIGALPFDVGSAHYVATMGKDGRLHLANRDDLGGLGGALVVSVASPSVIPTGAVIATPSGTILAVGASGKSCPAGSGNGLLALRIDAGAPPTVTTAWCAAVSGRSSAIATTTGGGMESMIWIAGAQGDNALHGVNAETGAPIFNGSPLGALTRFNAPIVAKGRIYVAGVGAVYAFTVR